MSNISGRAPAKFCPRCGAFYNDLPSKTCPQCFAPLEVLSDDTAELLVAEQESRKRDPEAIARKQADDEVFKEQAFGGCFGIASIILLTLILSVVIICVAMHRRPQPFAHLLMHSAGSYAGNVPAGVYLPKRLGSYQMTTFDQSIPSTEALWFQTHHALTASYTGGVTVYCVPATLGSVDMTHFREVADLVQDDKGAMSSRVEVMAHGLDYLVFAPTATEANAASNALGK